VQVGYLVGSSVVCLTRDTWFSLVFGNKSFTDCSLPTRAAAWPRHAQCPREQPFDIRLGWHEPGRSLGSCDGRAPAECSPGSNIWRGCWKPEAIYSRHASLSPSAAIAPSHPLTCFLRKCPSLPSNSLAATCRSLHGFECRCGCGGRQDLHCALGAAVGFAGFHFGQRARGRDSLPSLRRHRSLFPRPRFRVLAWPSRPRLAGARMRQSVAAFCDAF
jgi:hypothetical protein